MINCIYFNNIMSKVWKFIALGIIGFNICINFSLLEAKSLNKDFPVWVKAMVEPLKGENQQKNKEFSFGSKTHSSDTKIDESSQNTIDDNESWQSHEDTFVFHENYIYYRAIINLISLQYEKSLADTQSGLFRSTSNDLSVALEEVYSDLPGEQFVTVLKFEKAPELGNGTIATIDIGSLTPVDDEEQIKNVLQKTIKEKTLGRFQLQADHFEFKKVSGNEQKRNSCEIYEFKCKDGFCIDDRRRCDGIPQCPDHSDESKDWGFCNLDPTVFVNVSEIYVRESDTIKMFGFVEHLGSATMLWTKSDNKILSIGQTVITIDKRISVSFNETTNLYELTISEAKLKDSGNYSIIVDLRDRKINGTFLVHVLAKAKNESITSTMTSITLPPGYLPVRDGHRGGPFHAALNNHQPQQGRCPNGYYQCNSGHCLDANRWCDSHVDCPDHDDESMCQHASPHNNHEDHRQKSHGKRHKINGNHHVQHKPDEHYRSLDSQATTIVCMHDEFKCLHVEKCIPHWEKCNGIYDCPDCSDENDCPNDAQCRLNDFKCLSGECISLDRRCNGHQDCHDGSDEQHCNEDGNSRHEDEHSSHCHSSQMKCKSGECISLDLKCNRHYDCADGSDEHECHETNTHEDDSNHQSCSHSEFTCRNWQCIEQSRRCDAYPDCSDHSDEEDCQSSQHTCHHDNEFKCVSNECIDIRRRCDGHHDCNDGSDEYDCLPQSSHACELSQFQCGTGHCLDSDRRCDGHPDCPDNSDETDCAEKNHNNQNGCTNHEFHCKIGGCISLHYKCDKKPDCPDSSDELDCRELGSSSIGESEVSCTPDQFACPDGSCLNIESRCNGRKECSEGYDELNCEGEVHGSNGNGNGDSSINNNEFCDSTEFECEDTGDCIDVKLKCDGVRHCMDGSDERGCRTPVEPDLAPRACKHDEFRCTDGKCIAQHHKCDGTPHCTDSSDEHNCPSTDHQCHADQFKCDDNQCIHLQQKCDRNYDCRDYSDEKDCHDYNEVTDIRCLDDEFKCTTGNQCIDINRKCDDYDDCPDASDEKGCPKHTDSETHHRQACRPDEFTCKSGDQCIDAKKKCDRNYDCYDYSDEDNCETNNIVPETGTCHESEFRCRSDSHCIDVRRKCDGHNDCADGSDEKDCTNDRGPARIQCSSEEFMCKNGLECIAIKQKCDRNYDCGDFSDELDCHEVSNEVDGGASGCLHDEFKCLSDDQCIHNSRKCDKHYDCNDYSDERDCAEDRKVEPHAHSCRHDEFKCTRGDQCIDIRRKCDRNYDCTDYSDEHDCVDEDNDISTSPSCNDGEFMCHADRYCIDVRRRCDDHPDCSDHSDEHDCAHQPHHRACDHHEFRCKNGDCIDVRRKCDRRADCPDGSDESHETCDNNEVPTIPPVCTKFLCGTGECLDLNVKCNRKYDCGDGSDEEDCSTVKRCTEHEFQCNNGDCIDNRRKCDRRMDCNDGSDEQNCPRGAVTEEESFPYLQDSEQSDLHIEISPPNRLSVQPGQDANFHCRVTGESYATVSWSRVGGPLPYGATDQNGHLSIQNIQPNFAGTYICTAADDRQTKEVQVQLIVESDHGRTAEVQSGRGFTGGRCGIDEATCQNGECIKRENLCDGDYDCRDRSDELNCGHGQSKDCQPNEFKCDNSKCVQKMWVCDDEDDCGDKSDEKNCGTKGPGDACAPYQYKCQTRDQCIARSYQCDGQNDCVDGTDEVGCLAPTVVEPPVRELSVCRGQTIIITCRAVGGPVPHINWRLNWGPVCPPPRCTQVSDNGRGTLNIRDANDQDQGAYTCEAVNVKGRVLAVPDAIVTVTSGCGQQRPDPSICNQAGTLSEDRGRCTCKTYARGPDCGNCVENAFYLAPRNPQGCLRCFCMGITRTCDSSNYYRTQERLIFTYDDQGVSTTDLQDSRPETPRTDLNRYRGFVTVTSSQQPGTLYWKMPERLIGNKLTAYGGNLKFSFQYSGYGDPSNDPLVVLKGNEITLVYRTRDRVNADRPNEVNIDMYETSWTREDGREATREHFLMTLAGLETFLIRQTHCQGQSSSSLGEVVLDIAVSTDTQQDRAHAVEQCRCPEGYIGLSCEDCAPGYERTGGGLYLGTCQLASTPPETQTNCNLGGSVSAEPDPRTGRCQCKEYATGDNCDQCKPHSFYLSPKNADGCLSCFCSGVTKDCDSSNYYRTQERLVITQGVENDLVIRTNEPQGFFTSRSRPSVNNRRQLTITDFSDAPHGRPLYLELPKQFIGNKITSYGGDLKIVFRYSGGGGRTDSNPTVVIRGSDITLYYKPKQEFRPDTDNTLIVPFYEHHWTREDGLQSTREHLLMTLAGLSSILVKLTHGNGYTSSVSISELTMDYAVDRPTGGERAWAVEQCRCPVGYKGTSCEECAGGYSRTGGGLYLGLCEKCFCNNHSDKCDPEFGDCLDCQHNTQDPRCSTCQTGFTGDATRGTPDDCRPDRQFCQNCQCNNHSPRGCDLNCRCLFCEHNTEGGDCGECKRGFYGNARHGTPHDCKPCPCPQQKDCYLDHNGQVVCKDCPPGYTGPLCKDCADGYMRDVYEPAICRPIGRHEERRTVYGGQEVEARYHYKYHKQ